jgi:hypothetical protein
MAGSYAAVTGDLRTPRPSGFRGDLRLASMLMDAIPCRLCGAPFPDDGGCRCPNCGLYRAVDLGRSGFLNLGAGLVGVYLLTALLVLLTRGW